MSELSDLVGVLGAIDDHIVEHPDLIPDVGRLLCPYNNGAAGWYPVFHEWMADLPPFDGEPVELPDLDDALANLADFDDDAPQAPDHGLRMLTLAVLGRLDGRYAPGGEKVDLPIRALMVPGLAEDSELAEKLLELLTDAESYPDAESWDRMMAVALNEGYISAHAAQPVRCSGSVVEVGVPGQQHPATTVTTTLIADDLEFDDAVAFLDPALWPQCGPAWCKMTPAGTTPDGLLERYEEVIGLACPTPFLTTCLGFRKVVTSGLSVVGYRLIPAAPHCSCDGRVLIDEGSITVRDRTPDPGVTITTTKRVLFRGVPPGPLSMFSCILGYGDMGALLVYKCAGQHGGGKGKRKGKGKKKTQAMSGDQLESHLPPEPQPGGVCADVIEEVATLAKGCVTDSAKRYRKNLERAATGAYTTDDAAADAAAMWKRSAGDLGKAVELALHGLGIAQQSVAEQGDDPEDAE